MTVAGQAAPDFSLTNQDGARVSIRDYRNSWVVLYFYPKDDTPGCTAEACSLRDARDELADMGAEVVGVSMDGAASHAAFKARHRLNFTLLSDPEAATIRAYGAWGATRDGHEGVQRKTFLINPEGEIRKVYERVTPEGHGAQVIADLRQLRAAEV